MRLRGTTVSIVGAGRVGRALGRLLRAAGAEIAAVRCRSLGSARRAVRFIGAGTPQGEPRGLVFVTVPDGEIARVARGQKGTLVHCSGLLSAAEAGTGGSFHPLRSFADPATAAAAFAGTPVAVEGRLASKLAAVARAIGGVPFRVTGKAAYHAGAVFASNYVVAVVEAAVRLLGRAGIGRHEALRLLLPLTKGTVANLEAVGLPRALTGPVDRGDLGTVRRHLRAAGRLRPLYAALGRMAAEVARAKGSIDARMAARLDSLFRGR